jgi:gluconolactonase
VSRLELDGSLRVLADRYRGKRLNSSNDLVYTSDGALLHQSAFPPFGLPESVEDPRKQLPFSGVYRWEDGDLTLLADEFSGPNGIAFSPDEKWLYVGTGTTMPRSSSATRSGPTARSARVSCSTI